MDVATAASPSAAETLLGNRREGLRAEVCQLWRTEIEPHWRERNARAGALAHRLTSLDQAVPEANADVDSLWDKARVLIELRGDKSVELLLQQILVRRPDHAPANFQLGRLLLKAGNGDGELYLERVMAEEDDAVPQACALLREHYRRTGRADRIREVEARLDRHENAMAASRAERTSVTAADTLLAHGLGEAELQKLREALAADPQLAYAELAQKELKHFPRQKLFVLCVHRWQPWHRLPNHDQDRVLAGRIARNIHLPGRVLVIPPTGSFSALARKLRRVPVAEVYRHGNMKSGA